MGGERWNMTKSASEHKRCIHGKFMKTRQTEYNREEGRKRRLNGKGRQCTLNYIVLAVLYIFLVLSLPYYFYFLLWL